LYDARLPSRTCHHHRDRNHFIELQAFFAGIHAGDGAAENQAARPGFATSGLRSAIACFICLLV
jgi:hypothetical protein